jgi:4,5-dihydroxyphthalate decarboxylase
MTYSGIDYWDRTLPLITGQVQPEGIDLTYFTLYPPELWRRTLESAEFEASEISACSYLTMRAAGDDRFVGLPVFPSRNFRHGYIFLRSDAGIEAPQDLAGRRVGVGNYQETASLWMRALLQHDYDVPASAIHWVQPALQADGRPDAPISPDIEITTAPSGKTLEQLLLAGEIDAIMSPQRPQSLLAGDPRVKRLFPNFREAEQDYFKRTGFYPIMHMVVMRRDIYERHRWIANALLFAFEEAKAAARKRLQNVGVLSVSLPWLVADLEEANQVMGPDPFQYGFEANRPILEAMTQYLVEQGLSQRKLDPEELFAPETLGTRLNLPPAR